MQSETKCTLLFCAYQVPKVFAQGPGYLDFWNIMQHSGPHTRDGRQTTVVPKPTYSESTLGVSSIIQLSICSGFMLQGRDKIYYFKDQFLATCFVQNH